MRRRRMLLSASGSLARCAGNCPPDSLLSEYFGNLGILYKRSADRRTRRHLQCGRTVPEPAARELNPHTAPHRASHLPTWLPEMSVNPFQSPARFVKFPEQQRHLPFDWNGQCPCRNIISFTLAIKYHCWMLHCNLETKMKKSFWSCAVHDSDVHYCSWRGRN